MWCTTHPSHVHNKGTPCGTPAHKAFTGTQGTGDTQKDTLNGGNQNSDLHRQLLPETQVCIKTPVSMQSFAQAQTIPSMHVCSLTHNTGTYTLSDRLHTPSHPLRSMYVFQFPTNFCIVTDLYHSTNVNLFQRGFHADSVINIHTHHWKINLHPQVFLATTHADTEKWDSCPARCKSVVGIGIPAYQTAARGHNLTGQGLPNS